MAQGFMGYIISISSVRAMPRFLLVLTMLINDLAFYKYHRKFQPEYPESVQIFMESFDLMKELGVNPFSYFAFSNSAGQAFSAQNNETVEYLGFTQHDPQQVYFLYSISGFLQSTILVNLCYFAIFKLIHLVLYSMRECHWIFGKCYRFIRDQTRWWTLTVSIIEINLADLVFSSSLQCVSLGWHSFVDKLNFTLMIFVSLVVVFYVFCFYSLVHSKERKISKNLLIYSKHRMRSYFFQPILLLSRSALKTFFHGFLIYSYSTQIVMLFVLDIIFFIFSLLMRKSFRNRVVFFFTSLYMAVFLLFDFYFVLEYHTGLIR